MTERAFRELAAIKGAAALRFDAPAGACLVCPDMGGRVFGELQGQALHRIDLETVRQPDQPFANFGGSTFWPAPEGGPLGFNYRGDTWYVPPCINRDPFRVRAADAQSAHLEKDVALANRAGVRVAARMERRFRLAPPLPAPLAGRAVAALLAYETTDTFRVTEPVRADAALLGAWSLEQFPATDATVSFALVSNPRAALNEDYYDPPGARLAFHARGFTYRTDGRRKGQVGVRQAAAARGIGCYDLSRRLLVVRENRTPPGGLYFNIADNDQPRGPRSAADAYSIFNSDPAMGAFELETIGPARIEDDRLAGSTLVSVTACAAFASARDLSACLADLLGPAEA